MYVCICNAIKEKELRKAAQELPAASAEELYAELGVEPVCGTCLCYADDVIDTERAAVGTQTPGARSGGIGLYSSASLKPA